MLNYSAKKNFLKVFLKEGDRAMYLIFIKRGEVETSTGERYIDGQYFCQDVLFDKTAVLQKSVTARSVVELYRLHRDNFIKVSSFFFLIKYYCLVCLVVSNILSLIIVLSC